MTTYVNVPVPGSRNPVAYINGLTASWLSNTTLTLNTGACSDSTNTIDIVVPTAITINAAVNGVAGLDTGTFAAGTFYYVYVIGDSNGFYQPSVVISASAPTTTTGPLMPYGYDCWRMVDIKVTDGSVHFVLSYTYGHYAKREFIYDAPLTIGSLTTANTYTSVPLTGVVAPIGTPDVFYSAAFTANVAGHIAYLRPTGATGNYAELSGVVASVVQAADIECPAFVASGTASVDFKTTTSSDALTLLVKSFIYSV